MIVALALILLAQLAGEVAARGLGLPVPGPVIGMALLLAVLWLRDRGGDPAARVLPAPLVDGTLEGTGKGLLAHLSLMFVPAGVGIVGRLDLLADNAAALATVLLVSATLTLAATVGTFLAVARLVRGRDRSG